MSITPLTSALVLVGAVDASGQADSMEIAITAQNKEYTTFGSGGFVQQMAVLKGGTVKLDGFADYSGSGVDQWLAGQGIGANFPVSVAIPGTAAGDPAHFTYAQFESWTPVTGKVGDLARTPVNFGISNGVPEVKGLLGATLTSRSASDNGSAVALTGPSASQKLYAALHCTGFVGGTAPTLVVKVQSDDNSGFTSATDRITFSTLNNTPGTQFSSVAGDFSTETYHRASWTITGTPTGVTFAVFFGVF